MQGTTAGAGISSVGDFLEVFLKVERVGMLNIQSLTRNVQFELAYLW